MKRDDLLEVVIEDLRFIREDWHDSIDDHSLRRASPVLRRLLVEDDLQRAWRRMGFEASPRIPTYTLRDALGDIPMSEVRFASAGGAVYRGNELAGAVFHNARLSSEEMADRSKREPAKHFLALQEFIEDPCIYFAGAHITPYFPHIRGAISPLF